MLKPIKRLTCLKFECRKRVLDYSEIERHCGIKSFNYEYLAVLKNRNFT